MRTIKDMITEEIVAALKNGSVLVFPTDTVYGLIADASNKRAVEKIFAIKKRLLTMVLPVFISNIKTAKELAVINSKQEKELVKHWPGAYTFVLKRKPYKKELFGLDVGTIALRIPDYSPLNQILEQIDIPLVQTSANLSGKPATGNIEEVLNQFKNNQIQPDLVIDTGNLPPAFPSTIIDLVNKNKVLRK